MSALSLYYLIKSVNECIASADNHRVPSNALVVCGLAEGSASLVNVLSAVTSASMLMYPAFGSWRFQLKGELSTTLALQQVQGRAGRGVKAALGRAGEAAA
jgi:hypothetical protein